MKKSSIEIFDEYQIADIDNRIFSSFIEHLGRAVYSGIYEPQHVMADDQGFRKDVIALVKELGISLVRYPGGNFLSGYDWKDGIGPRQNRPRRLDPAWHSIEPNLIGIDEFYDWTKKTDTSIMGAVNMGTGTAKDAAELLEYCNFDHGTYWSDLRIQNGHTKPYNIKTWCVGNEMDGSWQIGHLDAVDYGKKARETAKLMKMIDNSIELVVCGSSSSHIATYPEWDRTILEYTYDNIDYLSLHQYYENNGNDTDFLASFVNMNNFIKNAVATVDYVKAQKRSSKTINLSFDEWNVWYKNNMQEHDWMIAPEILEDNYSLLDALVFAGMGIVILNNADRVKIACLAQLVNVIAPIITQRNGMAIKQTIFYPFKDFATYARGTVLGTSVKTDSIQSCYGDAPFISISAVKKQKINELTLFCLNIDQKDVHSTELKLSSFQNAKMTNWYVLNGPDINIRNTFQNPYAIVPKKNKTVQSENKTFKIDIQPLSWNVLTFEI